MSEHILKNNSLTVKINEFGAELSSIMENQTNTEYLWNADPAYWKRCSPVLFPFVGSLQNKNYTYQGKQYAMPQHGFARDMNFTLKSKNPREIWFSLSDTEDTFKIYPFRFHLEIGYELLERSIIVKWKVINPAASDLYFSIGAHPAFLCPLKSNDRQSDYFIIFDNNNPIHYNSINENGLMIKKPRIEQTTLTNDHGYLPVIPHMFDNDALIIEDNQCHKVSLAAPNRKPYLTVTFDAPLFGLWSPAKKNAPFICIEPWYGRCDSSDFQGSLEERDWGNKLEAGRIFEASYSIEII